MASDQEQLVRQVTEQVLSAMGKPVIAAPIHPPAGTCTGDYSKFRPDKSGGTSGAPSAAEQPAQPLRGIVTARHLEGLGKVVRLASCARLTPLATDYVKENGITLERGSAVAAGNSTAATPQAGATWFWWCEGAEPAVDAVMTAFRSQIKPMSQPRSTSALTEVIRQLARRVAGGAAAGGVLFVDSAARAGCFANRSQALRAVVGTGDAAVERGIREIGANVLIIEHPAMGRRSMRDMVSRFIRGPRSAAGEVERQLRELVA